MKHLMLCVCVSSIFCSFAIGQTHFGIMTYNCENAFDTIHDVGYDDYEFLPDGEREWKRWKFYDKIKNVAKVILATDTIHPVDLVCLCEVENDTVMSYLTKRTFLARIGYEYVMTKSNDTRGLDVAIMYMPFTFKYIESQIIKSSFKEKTRDVLRVTGRLLNGDTLDVFALHLPSKLGGSKSDKLRRNIVRNVRLSIDSLFALRLRPNIVVMGDFNAGDDTDLINKTLNVERFMGDVKSVNRNELYKILSFTPDGCGTYKYKGAWSIIDNILISGAMLEDGNVLSTKTDWCKIIDLPFLLEPDKSDRSIKPKRSFLGTHYRDGYSDHLPAYIKFQYLINQ